MKKCFLLACLILAGCGRSGSGDREVLSKLDAIKSELTAKRAEPVRWAFANKRDIDSAIFKWSHDQMEGIKKSEALPPEVEQKIQQYETLQAQFFAKEMELRGYGIQRPLRMGIREVPPPDEAYLALSNQVAAARAPIAAILERRNKQASQFRAQFSTENLIAEYAQGHFDLVVDSGDERMSRSAVLYRTNGAVLDLTDGIIKLFRNKTKP
jgi:hypothetical protein